MAFLRMHVRYYPKDPAHDEPANWHEKIVEWDKIPQVNDELTLPNVYLSDGKQVRLKVKEIYEHLGTVIDLPDALVFFATAEKKIHEALKRAKWTCYERKP